MGLKFDLLSSFQLVEILHNVSFSVAEKENHLIFFHLWGLV